METISNEGKVLREIRDRLMRFCNCRERAYQVMRRKGYPVPDYSAKLSAILFIRIHLQASEQWPLAAHVRMISQTLRKHINVLLPHEFHDQDRMRSYRKHILDLLRFCDERFNERQITLLTTKPHAA